MRTRAEHTAAGFAAVGALGRERGLPVDDLRVLSARGNLVVHLAPAPVVARVATLTAFTRRDPSAWMAREVGVAAHAAGRGGPVVAPLDDAGPHRRGGLGISLWEFHATRPGRARGRELGALLAALHTAAAGYPGDLPHLAPATDQVDDALHALERDRVLPTAILVTLRRHATVLADLDGAGSPPVVLHGDAHAGNLLHTATGWRWIDLEETCTGPPEWDLAVLTAGDPDRAAATLAGYADATGRPAPDRAELVPFAWARDLEATVWLLAMAHQFPARYRAVADERLADLLSR